MKNTNNEERRMRCVFSTFYDTSVRERCNAGEPSHAVGMISMVRQQWQTSCSFCWFVICGLVPDFFFRGGVALDFPLAPLSVG